MHQLNEQSAPNVPPQKGIMLPMAVGLSVGLSLGALSQSKIVDRFFPKSSEPDKAPAAVDPKIIDAYINQAKQINQLEVQLTSLKEDLRERDRTVAQAPPVKVQTGDVNVVELSKVLRGKQPCYLEEL